MKKILFTLFVLLFGVTAYAQYTISVEISNVPNNKGAVAVALYKKENWLGDPYKGAYESISDNTVRATFTNVPKGEYAVSIFHDENSNKKLDTNFMGIPKEDYACSNDAKGFFGPPKYQDAKFSLIKNTTVKIKF